MVIHDNKVYEQVTTDLFTVFKEVETPEASDIVPEFHGKPIPMRMWHDIMHCMKQTQDEFNSEALVFLFYNADSNQPWSWWLPPQQTNGMTVKSLPNDPEYKKQRAEYPDLMLGTVHHHCTSSAFQSGTDEADEVNREGLHFTIGHLDKDKVDVHFRMSLGGQCVDMDAHTYIEKVPSPFKKNAKVSDQIYNAVVNRMTQDAMIVHSPENKDYSHLFDNIHKPTIGYKNNKVTGLGAVGWDDRDDWWDKQYYKPTTKRKKNSHEEVADDLLTAFLTDYEYEDCLINYYSYLGDNSSSQRLTTSNLDEEVIKEDILKMLVDDHFQATTEGKQMLKIIEAFCEEQKQFGVDTTIADIQHGLSILSIEDGSTVQYMDQEAVL